MLSNHNQQFPFKKGDWVEDTQNPGRPGIFTGETSQQGPFQLIELEYGPGDRRFRPLQYLAAIERSDDKSIKGRLGKGRYGNLADLQRIMTFEKLKGTLREIIYSMEAAQIDFYPYQFKPVVKFIESPTERMIIADEVGLGKTIESALIWLELQARKQAKRLLVVCPTEILAQKWVDELRQKFIIDARLAKFPEVQNEFKELEHVGPTHAFALVCTYSGLRPPRGERERLDDPQGESKVSPKTAFCQNLRAWQHAHSPFDLVIFDEAHHMRNAGTSNFQLGDSLSKNAGAVLCVSATPVNNGNNDLHSLLRLVDEDFFRNQSFFGQLLETNRPAVQLANALARTPVDEKLLQTAISGLSKSPFIQNSPLFARLRDLLNRGNLSKAEDIAKCQTIAEHLNLLGSYVTRTRRNQVKEHRPVREPVVLEVQFNKTEMHLYSAILGIVRKRCQLDSRPFHIFQVIGLQMRAASSLAVLASEIQHGRFGDAADLLFEAFGDLEIDGDDPLEIGETPSLETDEIAELLNYDYEVNDSKYTALESHIFNKLKGEKVVIFSFFKGTLHYLERRLNKKGITTSLINGDVNYDERKEVVDAFNATGGPQVLLSSEVGSEGIDMHHNCRCLVNYDLPWNPMRVEQRIGRIDRVGQKAERLSIIHLKIKDTIEERIYDRLHQRLMLFANSLGDLESVIGREVQELTVDLLSNNLSKEEEEMRILERERVIQTNLESMKLLEQEGEGLVAHADFFQKKIDEDRGRGRYVRPEELEAYIRDFFEREFKGTALLWDSPSEGCLALELSSEAHRSLYDFVKEDQSMIARPLKQKRFALTFRREIFERLDSNTRKKVAYANHLSPLIRWMTKQLANKAHNFFNLSALEFENSELTNGCWLYRIERWYFRGLRNEEKIAQSLIHLETKEVLSLDKSEMVVNRIIGEAQSIDYPEWDKESLLDRHSEINEFLLHEFNEALADFQAQNKHSSHIRSERAKNLFDRKIEQIEQRITTLRQNQRSENVIRLMEAQLKNSKENRAIRLSELKAKAEVDCERSEVAAGLINVV